ncbi:class I SAM-dependent methyltransferase [Rhodovibrio salinarum]|nr:class I SAM-dependent methyltransferase [Rhodovibrio salinarum]
MRTRETRRHTEMLSELLGDLKGHLLVDVGCGHGALARRLASMGAEVVGLDPQETAVTAAMAADLHSGAHWITAGGAALPLATGTLDDVLYFNALHHVPVDELETALGEAHRALKPEGRLLAVEPIAEGPLFDLTRMVEDETAVRAAADDALTKAHGGTDWQLVARLEYLAPVKYESFQAFRNGLIRVDPAREPTVSAQEDWLRERFTASARQADGAYWLDQPTRATLLQRL